MNRQTKMKDMVRAVLYSGEFRDLLRRETAARLGFDFEEALSRSERYRFTKTSYEITKEILKRAMEGY